MNFLSCSKIGLKSLYYSTVILAKLKVENSPFLYFSLVHIHALRLCFKFELILITFGFIMIF